MPRLQTPRKSRFTVVLTDASQLIVTGSICHSKFSSQNTIHVYVWLAASVPSAIEQLQLLDPDYGTVFHRAWKRRTYRTVDSGCR